MGCLGCYTSLPDWGLSFSHIGFVGLRIGYRGARGMPRIPGASLSVRLSCSHQYPCLQNLSLGLPFYENLFTIGGGML